MFRKRKQVQVDTKDEAQVLLLKGQIDGLFKIFEGVIDYLKEDDIEDRHLLRLNDAAVANLNLFGQCCMSKDGKKEILNVAHGHFSKKKDEMDRAHRRIVKPWLEYTECALLGNKLEELQISQITIDAGKRNMNKGDHMTKFVSRLVGAEHKANNVVKNAKENRGSLKEQHAKEAQRNKQEYEKRKMMVKCPNQNSMYNVAGGGQNIQFGSATLEEKANEEQKSEAMNLDQQEKKGKKSNEKPTKVKQKKAGDKIEEKESQQLKESMSEDGSDEEPALMSQNEYRMNAYVKEAPPRPLYKGNVKLKIEYPYPCKIEKFKTSKIAIVTYAKPCYKRSVEISVSNLERDPEKVSKKEQEFLAVTRKMGCSGLGYPSIRESKI